jgi:hypothetical protein
MTTAWAYLVRGDWQNALRTNVGGTLLGLLAAAAVAWLLGSAIRGAWWLVSPRGDVAAWISTVLLAVTLVDWVVRLRFDCGFYGFLERFFG